MTQAGESIVVAREPAHTGHGSDHGAGHGESEVFDPTPHRPTARGLIVVGVLGAVVVGALVVAGIIPRALHRTVMEHDEERAATEMPRVIVAKAARATTGSAVSLPGSVQPLRETSLYARVNGYVRKWNVDIGAPVKQGQVMAELDVPDIDEELRQVRASANQAKAAVAQAKSQLDLARMNNERYIALTPSGVASQQQIDSYASAFDVQRSNLLAAEAASGSADANVRRIEDLKSFGTLTAPFDGVVTFRNAEIGQLVASGTGNGQALYKVAEVDVVRFFVNVPQLYAAGIVTGMDAPTKIREAPGRVFPGKVARTSNELDVATRTLLVEVDIPNPDRALVSGMYATVSFDVKRQDQPIFVPATAVIYDASGTRAAAVEGGTVHWKKVDIEADLGDKLAIATGIAEGDEVAVTPNERLIEGMRVRTEAAK